MSRVYKYPINGVSKEHFEMRLYKILSIVKDENNFYFYCIVNDTSPSVHFDIFAVFTGFEFELLPSDEYICTIFDNGLGQHFFIRRYT